MKPPHTMQNDSADATDSEAGAADRAQQTSSTRDGEPYEAWTQIAARVSELREYAGYYLEANVDRLRLAGRTAATWLILAVVGGLISISVVAAASVMLLVSLAAGLGELLGGRVWLGQLIVSVITLLAASGGTWFGLRRSLRSYVRAIEQKYERRQEEERIEYGTDVGRRARERSQTAQ